MARINTLTLVLTAVLGTTAQAQVALSGIVDLVEFRSFGDDEQPTTDININNRGDSPFNQVRARFFVDAAVSDDILITANLLFDDGATPRLDGAQVDFYRIKGIEVLNARAGRLPTAFGSFATRTYSDKNPVIGAPLIYHYHTALQGMAVPADPRAQLALRENLRPLQTRGLPVLYDSCWDTGIELFGAGGSLAYALAITKATVSNPKAMTNDGYQLVARLGVTPLMGLRLGLSGAYGPYLTKAAESAPARVGARSGRNPPRGCARTALRVS